jgi:hypothetical protein
MAVVNFPAMQTGRIMSACLVTGFHREDGAVLLAIPGAVIQSMDLTEKCFCSAIISLLSVSQGS